MTIKDIAKESGYAIGTVSRVLNNNPSVSPAARAKILEVIKRYNYQPNSNAKHLKQQSSDGLALIVKALRMTGACSSKTYPAARPGPTN